MKNITFNITILKWQQHNPKHKKGFDSFMLKNNFLTDHKVAELTTNEVLLFIHILCVASERSTQQVHITSKTLPKQLRMGDKSLTNCLESLESLQLVSVEKLPSLRTKRTELNGIELKESKVLRTKLNTQAVKKPDPQGSKNSDLNKKIWAAFHDAYFNRYKVEPMRNATTNSQISQLAKRLGEEAIEVVKFYVSHNDTFYVSKAHQIGLCLKDAEALRTQFIRGHQITRAGLKRFENAVGQQELLNAIDRGEV